jgi:hypothetical protein
MNDWLSIDIPAYVIMFTLLAVMLILAFLPHRADRRDPRRLPRGEASSPGGVRLRGPVPGGGQRHPVRSR